MGNANVIDRREYDGLIMNTINEIKTGQKDIVEQIKDDREKHNKEHGKINSTLITFGEELKNSSYNQSKDIKENSNNIKDLVALQKKTENKLNKWIYILQGAIFIISIGYGFLKYKGLM